MVVHLTLIYSVAKQWEEESYSLGGAVEPVHGVHELVVQHVGVLVGREAVRHQALRELLVVSRHLVAVLCKDFHAESLLRLTLVRLAVLQLCNRILLLLRVTCKNWKAYSLSSGGQLYTCQEGAVVPGYGPVATTHTIEQRRSTCFREQRSLAQLTEFINGFGILAGSARFGTTAVSDALQ